ncbi:MAG: hypothetical protein ACPG5B_09970 [Chitinophagales bacterium]
MPAKTTIEIRQQQFEKLSIQECHLIYPILLENAERHIKTAINIARIKEYGIANSHLIMAADDYINALSVYLKGWGLPVSEIKTLTNFFSEQEAGYAVSPGVVIMGNFVKSLYHIFDSLSQSILKMNPLELRKIFEKNMSPLLLIKKSNQYAAWWQQAKQQKDKGLYVSFNIELSTPKSITAQDYMLSLEIIKEIHENCHSVIDFTKQIPEKRRQQFFSWIKNYFEPFMKRINSFPFNWKI